MSNFTKSEIEIILNNLNTMTFYQFIKQLEIKDEEIQIEIQKLLNDNNPKHKRKNEKRLKYLTKSYLLKHLAPEDLIDFYKSLETDFAQKLFDPMRFKLMEIIENINKYMNICRQKSIKEEEYNSNESDEIEQELESLMEYSFLFESNIALTYQTLDIYSKKALLSKLLKENSIDIIAIIWQYTENDLKKEFLPAIMNFCNNNNLLDKLISFYRATPTEIKTIIDKDLNLASMTFNATTKITEAEAGTRTHSHLFWKNNLYNLIKNFLAIPKEQRQYFFQDFYSIFEKINNKTNLDYNQQIASLLESANFNPIEILELFQDKLNIEHEFCLKIDDLNEEVINTLISFLSKGYSLSLSVTIKSSADLSIEQLRMLDSRIKIKEIRFNDTNLTYWQKKPYTLEQYIACREKIDSILDGIDLTRNPNDPDCEKKIFGKVIRRLANLITYDYDLYKKIDDETIDSTESFQCASMLGALTVANDEGYGLAVCSGFSETARNIFKCCGIDILVVSGKEKCIKYVDGKEKEKIEGHQWNQIKLDGQWYWMDLTWARDYIVSGLIPNNLLKSDKDFQNHLNVFNYGTELQNMTVYPAPESISPNKLNSLLYPQYESRGKQIHITTRYISKSTIRDIITGLENFQHLPATSKENEGDEYGD